MDRIKEICSHISYGKRFADVGCDHGYCAQYVLKHNLCETCYISDISKGSLSKAEALLKEEIAKGRCIPVVADGMKGLPKDCDVILIAGLGGEETIKIFEEGYLPQRFVLQPMRNADKVRAYLLQKGCKILKDYTFGEGIYYDLIVGTNQGGDSYTDWEIKFGRDNLMRTPKAFLEKMKSEQEKLRSYLTGNLSIKSRDGVRKRLYELEVITDAVEGDL